MSKFTWLLLFISGSLVAQQNEEFEKRLDSLKIANNYSEYIYTSLDEFSKSPSTQNLIIFENVAKNLWRKPLSENEYLAQIYLNINYGYNLKQFGFISKSVLYYEKAKEVFEKHPSSYNIIEFCYKPLANNYTRLGDYKRAEDLLKVTITKSEQKNDTKNVLAAYSNLAIVKRSLGDFNEAIDYLILVLKKSDSNKFSSNIYADLAINYLFINDIENAEINLKLSNSLTTDIKVLSKNYQTQGNIYLLKNEFNNAEVYFYKALPLAIEFFGKNDREIGKLYNQIAECKMGLGLFNEAVLNYELSLNTLIPNYSEIDFQSEFIENYLQPENTLLESFDGLAKANIFLNKLDKALTYYSFSFLVENQLQQTFTTQQAKLIQQQGNSIRSERCIEICYELFEKSNNIEWIEKAFMFAEKSKSSVLNEVKTAKFNKLEFKEDSIFLNEKKLLLKKAYLNKKIVIEELKNKSASIDLLTQYIQERDQISNQLQLLKVVINKKYPFINQSSKTISSNDIRNNILKDNQIFVEFFNGTKYVYRFVISKHEDISLKKIERDKYFEKIIDEYLKLFVAGNSTEIQNNIKNYTTLGFKLYNLLFSNIESKSLIIVPDGQLSFIPFDALITENTESLNFEILPYLVKKSELQLAYSATLLSLPKTNNETINSKILGFFPIFEQQNRGLATLNYTKNELQDIKTYFKGNYFEGSKALKSIFKSKSERAKIIHLSTHASAGDFYNPPSIEFFDETLYLPEIYGYNFSADLLILSACETGIGILQKGEGVMSLARGFSYAGVKNLIVSLWKVNDKSTQELMSGFYKNLKKTNNKSLSLHKSKLDYLYNEEIPSLKKSPYYWAGFNYIGENSISNTSKFHFWWLLIPVFLFVGFYLLKKR